MTTLALLLAIIIGIAHVVLLVMCAWWHYENITRIHDRIEYQRRRENPPWYTRYVHWVTRSEI